MSAVGFTSVGIFVLSALFVGGRLFGRGVRRRVWPEALLGSTFVLISVGYGGMLTVFLITGRVPSSGVLAVCGAILDLAFTAMGLFAWHVFHRSSRWRSFLSLSLVAGCVLLAVLGAQIPPLPAGAPGATPYRLVLRFVILAWSGWTSLSYHARMTRRLALGLADPVVTDRFRLWGLLMSGNALLVVTLTVGAVLELRKYSFAPVVNSSGALLGWLCIALLWFSFFPPKWYCDRLRSRASVAEDA